MALSLTHQPVDGHTSQRTNFRNTVGDVKLVSPSGLAAATISAHDGGRVASLVVEGMELFATDSTGGPLRRELNRGDPAEFSFEPKWMWHRASDGIPDGTRVSPSHEPWDDTFGGVSSPPMVCWPRAMQLSLEADCPVWVVYTERTDQICIEPQTGIPNAFNFDGPTVLGASESMELTLTMRWAGFQTTSSTTTE